MAEQDVKREAKAPPPSAGAPGQPEAPRPWYRPSGRWIVFFLVLLAFDFFLTSQVMGPESRERVPYSPYFLQQVRGGNVDEITSKGTAIQGTLRRAMTVGMPSRLAVYCTIVSAAIFEME